MGCDMRKGVKLQKSKLVKIINTKTFEKKEIIWCIQDESMSRNAKAQCPICGKEFIQASALYDTDWVTIDRLHHIGRCPRCVENSYDRDWKPFSK